MSEPTDKEKPYVFEKRIDKAFGAATVVLGPKAVRQMLVTLLGLPKDYASDDTATVLSSVLTLIDPTQQLTIETDGKPTSRMKIAIEPKDDFIGDTIQGYTLVDIKSALATAVREDITGLILELIQMQWDSPLTLGEAEDINFHLNKIFTLIK